MPQIVRIEENCDFQQIALPLEFGSGEHVLHHIHLEADNEVGAWYELYLILIPNGFLIEMHTGSSRGHGRLKETWVLRSLPDAKRKYSQIFSCKLPHKRRDLRKYNFVSNENEGQQKLFG